MSVTFNDVTPPPHRSSLLRPDRAMTIGLAVIGWLTLTTAAPAPIVPPIRIAAAPIQDASPFHTGASVHAASPTDAPLRSVAIRPLDRPGFSAPVDRFVVSSRYGLRRMSWESNARRHQGIDLAAPLGDPVRAVAAGVVTRVGWRGGYGLAIDIRHADGLVSTYAHLSGLDARLRSGSRVGAGIQIGEIGSTGSSTGPHLHLELRDRLGKALDPGAFLGGGLAPQGLREADADYRRTAVRSRRVKEAARNAPPLPRVTFVARAQPGRSQEPSSRLTFRTNRRPETIAFGRPNTITVRND